MSRCFTIRVKTFKKNLSDKFSIRRSVYFRKVWSSPCFLLVKHQFSNRWHEEISLLTPFAMVTSLKLFQSVRQFYLDMGLYPSQSNGNCVPNARNSFILLSMILFCITSSAFFLFEAKSIAEYGISFYMSLSEMEMTCFFLIIAWKMPKILELIDGMEQFIAKSKPNISGLISTSNFIHLIILLPII